MDFQAFFAQLKAGDIAKVYLFEGEEEYGKESALAALRKALLTGPLAMMNESVLTNPPDADLIAACETLPIMEARRLVIVRESQHLAGKPRARQEEEVEEDTEAEEPIRAKDDLAPYLERLPDTVCLLFFVRGKANASRKVYKKIKELGGVVSFDQLDPERLVKWIVKEFRAYGLQADRAVAEHLAFACGRELMTLKNEVAKIAAYAEGSKAVTQGDVDAVAATSIEYRVFDLADKVADGKAAQALPLMEDMLRGGEQRLMLLALLQRHYRQLLFARILTDDGVPQAAIARELGVPPFVARRLCQSAQAYTIARLRDAYLQCIEQEFLVKSGQLGEEGSLEQLVMNLIHLKKRSGAGSHA